MWHGISDFLSFRSEIISSNNFECSGHEEILNSSTSEIEELLSTSLQLEESKLNVSNLSRSLYTEKQLCKETKMEVKKINNKLSGIQKKKNYFPMSKEKICPCRRKSRKLEKKMKTFLLH